ncbi:hypothetical protein [Sorangium sp. So ce1151]|uniref:hypothetical protein n=1 Tax=Sorangium sp. So ce1151 TaxID=3133332 RepID=UPI003F61A269
MSRAVAVEACGHQGPRGLRCQLPAGHVRRHYACVDGPAEPCDVCDADAGEDCIDPRACARVRESVGPVSPAVLRLWIAGVR